MHGLNDEGIDTVPYHISGFHGQKKGEFTEALSVSQRFDNQERLARVDAWHSEVSAAVRAAIEEVAQKRDFLKKIIEEKMAVPTWHGA